MKKTLRFLFSLPILLSFQSCVLVALIQNTTIQENTPDLRPYDYLKPKAKNTNESFTYKSSIVLDSKAFFFYESAVYDTPVVVQASWSKISNMNTNPATYKSNYDFLLIENTETNFYQKTLDDGNKSDESFAKTKVIMNNEQRLIWDKYYLYTDSYSQEFDPKYSLENDCSAGDLLDMYIVVAATAEEVDGENECDDRVKKLISDLSEKNVGLDAKIIVTSEANIPDINAVTIKDISELCTKTEKIYYYNIKDIKKLDKLSDKIEWK